jgi:hypothetical protein
MSTSAKFGAHPKFSTCFLNGVEAEVKATRTSQNTIATYMPPSSQVSRSSTELSSRGRGRGRGYGQLGRGSIESREDRRSSRDLSANWRK